MKRLLLIFPLFLILLIIPAKHAYAQFDDVGDVLRAGVDDANLLLKNYMKPVGAGFGADLNSGWFNSARPYRTLGFDLRVTVAGAFVPQADRSFDVREIGLSDNTRWVDGNPETQTPVGSKDPGAVLGLFAENPFTQQDEEIFRFEMPEGTGLSIVPAPMAQLTVGVIRDTDLSIRYMPSVTVGDLSTGLFGIGVKHGLNQWMPGGKVLPIDLSIQMGYTSLTSNFGFDVQPDTDSDTYNPHSPQTWDGQSAEFSASAFTTNLLIGRNFPMLSVFAGLGFQSSETTFTTPGSYPVTVPNPDFDPTSTSEETRPYRINAEEDPINITIEGENSIHALAGFRIRLGFLAISGSYTVSKYPVANVGVGLSFR